jgi:DEAD/DEAH box helicase domain-containing protein
MTTWQRGGRVGRSGRESAIILLPQPDALDQYIARHPEAFLSSQYELAVIDPDNEEILKAHLPCAAWELPLSLTEIEQEKECFKHVVRKLTNDGKLLLNAEGDQWVSSTHQPHRHVDIRSIGASYAIVKASDGERQVPLGRTEGLRALKECHPGAVYLHRGESYQVDELDLKKRVIHVSQCRLPYFTRVKSDKETEILEVLASKPVDNFLVRLGRLRVTERITGFEMRRLFSQELLGANALELPPQVFETIGFWIEIEPALARRIQDSKLHFMGGIHAVEHAAISMFPLFALCDRNDIGGISIPLHPQVGKGAVFIYDGYPGGIGLAAKGYTLISDLLRKTRELIASCPCSEGCPACIHSPKCGAGNKPLDKRAALAVLNYLTGEWGLFDGDLDPAEENFSTLPVPLPEIPDPLPLRIGFMDIETQRLAEEVGGWKNKHLMRVSVAVLYDTQTGEFRSYRESEVLKLIEDLQELDLVVGFNLLNFDYQVLKAYAPQGLDHLPTLDILHEIHAIAGLRVSLGHLAEKTLGSGKTSDGLQAVRWFREGRWDDLIQYCTADVAITRDLFLFARDKGYLLYADRQERLLRIPAQWDLEKFSRKKEAVKTLARL